MKQRKLQSLVRHMAQNVTAYREGADKRGRGRSSGRGRGRVSRSGSDDGMRMQKMQERDAVFTLTLHLVATR